MSEQRIYIHTPQPTFHYGRDWPAGYGVEWRFKQCASGGEGMVRLVPGRRGKHRIEYTLDYRGELVAANVNHETMFAGLASLVGDEGYLNVDCPDGAYPSDLVASMLGALQPGLVVDQVRRR